jgi:tetratricopeptide (TPR) repeat protein
VKTCCLIAIVKNEEKIIERCLNSIKNIIDYYVIIDTGSTDFTIEKIKSSLINIPGEIHSVSWINFAVNRNVALQLAKNKADYAILLDADMVVEISNFNKEDLFADAYYIKYLGDLDYSQILLINNRLNWHYEGVTHEFITSSEAKNFVQVESLKINHLYDGSNRKDKFARDIKLLLQGIKEEPKNSRYYFYLANSYRDLGEYNNAITYYLQRVQLDGWKEEIFYSLYQLGYCYEQLEQIKDAKYYYLKAWEFRPTRAEPLYKLSVLCRIQKEYNQAYIFAKKGLEIEYPKDLLFIEKSIYNYLLRFEKSISAYWINKYQEAYEDCRILTKVEKIDEQIKKQNLINMQYSEKKLKENKI